MGLRRWEEIAKKSAKLGVWTSRHQKYPLTLTYTHKHLQSAILSSLVAYGLTLSPTVLLPFNPLFWARSCEHEFWLAHP